MATAVKSPNNVAQKAENGINLKMNACETTSSLQDQSHYCPTYLQNQQSLVRPRDDGDNCHQHPGLLLQGRLQPLQDRPRLEAQPDPDQVQLCSC